MHAKEEIIQSLEQASVELKQLFAQGGQEFLMYAPPTKWTAGQHWLHLLKVQKSLSMGLSAPKMMLRMQAKQARNAEDNYDSLYTLYKEGLKSFTGVEPSADPGTTPPDDTTRIEEKWDKYTHKIIQSLDDWSDKELDGITLKHPVIGWLTIRQFLFFLHFHIMHHINVLKEKYVQ